MKTFLEMTINERQIHNDYINCVKEFPLKDVRKEKPYTRAEEIERDLLILKRSVTYYKANNKE